MSSILDEKLAICYTCCGPTYRKSALSLLENFYFDDDNIYYCILTDDKSYFDNVNRKNLVVNELKDFYNRFPQVEKNEYFLESTGINDYAGKFVNEGYLFPFSTYRFNMLQAIDLGITNIALLCTDTRILINQVILEESLKRKNSIRNTVSEWDESIQTNEKLKISSSILKSKYNLDVEDPVRIIDAAGRLFVFNDLEILQKFFDIWNGVIEHIYSNDLVEPFRGNYVINDEHILAPIYQVLGLSSKETNNGGTILSANHNMAHERFWRPGPAYQNHNNYEEFLKINNIQNG